MNAPKDKTLIELDKQYGSDDNQLKKENLRLHAIKIKDFLALELPPRELILSPWLPTAGLCMIHAKPGVGKTHLSLNIAYAVAGGGSFLGWEAEKPRGVLFVDGEMYPAHATSMQLCKVLVLQYKKVAWLQHLINTTLQLLGLRN